MTSFFGNALGSIAGNPFSTAVGSRIEQATDAELASENWALNMEICDLVNETEDGPRDAVKAIRKRLAQNAGKNYTVVMYTLTVLETCVKNCGRRFHTLVCAKDFVQDLVKLIGPKNDPPTAVQEKVLSLIQAWADAFRSQPEMSGVVSVYQDLLAKGIEFPPTDLDAMAPIHTPQRTVESVEPTLGAVDSKAAVAHHNPSSPAPHPAQHQHQGGQMVSPAGLTAEQRAKLQSELDVVQSNMNVLGEMLSEMRPGHEQPDELELLQELYATCQSMQQRLMELIGRLSSDELTAELLRINDDLNNLFLRYSRWEKNREAGGQSASAVLAKAMPSATTTVGKAKPPLHSNDSLIDFEDDLPDKMNKLGVSGGTSVPAKPSEVDAAKGKTSPQRGQGDDEFDMFAQSRNASYETSKTKGSTYKDNREPDQISGGLSSATQGKPNTTQDLEFDEMANWLGETTGGEESVTSSEFERFLAERAAAADNLPNVAGSTNSNPTSTTTTTITGSTRTGAGSSANKADDKGLFAL